MHTRSCHISHTYNLLARLHKLDCILVAVGMAVGGNYSCEISHILLTDLLHQQIL